MRREYRTIREVTGPLVLVEEVESGCWVVKLGRFVPDSERWLHSARIEKELDEAIAWADAHPAEGTDLALLERRVRR